VYGSLLLGSTGLLFESTPLYPDAGRFWRMAEQHRFTQFFGAPTAYRMMMQVRNGSADLSVESAENESAEARSLYLSAIVGSCL
jgi:acyl-coenzyme A synthetase/AMP-(fatty) acid ligase